MENRWELQLVVGGREGCDTAAPPDASSAAPGSPPAPESEHRRDPIRDLTLRRTAQLLGLGRTTVRRRIGRGEIPAYQCHRRWLIPYAFVQASLVPPDTGAAAASGDRPARPGPASLATPTHRRVDAPPCPRAEACRHARQELLNAVGTWLDSVGRAYEPVLLGVLQEVLEHYTSRLRRYFATVSQAPEAREGGQPFGDAAAEEPGADP
jgi:excisionase family DNA binding protein